MVISAATDIGLVRKANQDSYLVDKNNKYCIVADGMGGHKAGEIASAMAVEEIGKYLDENKPETLHATVDALYEAIRRANNKVFKTARLNFDYSGMGTTIVMTYFYGEKDYYITTVGTSETLDEKVSVETKDSARLDAMVYISKDGKFIISSTDVLKTLKCYIRFAATLNGYASVDGSNWSAPIATWTTTAAPAYYTASVNNYSYKYFKVECTSSTREIWLMDFTLGMYSA